MPATPTSWCRAGLRDHVACVIVAAAKAQRLHRVLIDQDARNASTTHDANTYLSHSRR
jgi:hypothetical protein